MIQCADPGCEKWMHPMCAVHSRLYSRLATCREVVADPYSATFVITCEEHTPGFLRRVQRLVLKLSILEYFHSLDRRKYFLES